MLLDFSSEIYAWIRGAMLFVAVYSLVVFFLNKKKQYLYYSFFLFCFFIYFLKTVSNEQFIPFYTYFKYSLLFLGLAGYISFSRELLETKKRIPEWDQLIVLVLKSIFIAAFIFIIIQIAFGSSYQDKLFIFLMPIVALFSILTYIVLTKIKGKHVTYFIIGSISFLILTASSYILKQVLGDSYLEKIGFQPKLLMYNGEIIEMMMTALIMGKKLKAFEKNKIEIEGELAFKTKEMSDLKMTVL